MKMTATSWPNLQESPDARPLARFFALHFALLFPWRLRPDGQRMHRARQFRGQRGIYHAVALDPALPFEGRRYDIYPEVRLAARPVARMTLMQMRFVRDVEAFWQESFTQLVYDSVPGAHDGGR